MRLSELVSNITSNYTTQIAFVLFLTATLVILYITFSARNREVFDHARSLPLDDDAEEPS